MSARIIDVIVAGRVVSHLRFAAGVFVLAAGLLMGSAGGAVAVADPDSSGSTANGTDTKHDRDSRQQHGEDSTTASTRRTDTKHDKKDGTDTKHDKKDGTDTKPEERRHGHQARQERRHAPRQARHDKKDGTDTKHDKKDGTDTKHDKKDGTDTKHDEDGTDTHATARTPSTTAARTPSTTRKWRAPVPDQVAPVPDVVAPVPNVVAPVPNVMAPVPNVIASIPNLVAPVSDVIAPVQDMLTSVAGAVVPPTQPQSDLSSFSLGIAGVESVESGLGGIDGGGLSATAGASIFGAMSEAGRASALSGMAPPASNGAIPMGVRSFLRHALPDLPVAVSLAALAAVALPAVGVLVILTLAGVRVGYRQGKADFALWTAGIARFARRRAGQGAASRRRSRPVIAEAQYYPG